MAIRTNDPYLAQAATNLSQLFAPPSGADAAGWAAASAKNAEAQRLADLYTKAPDWDHQAVASNLYDPTNSFYAQDQNTATARRGQDVESSDRRYGTDRSFNASVLNNQNTVRGGIVEKSLDAVPQGALRPGLDPTIAAILGLPPQGIGQIKGTPTQLTTDQLTAAIMGGQPVDAQRMWAQRDVPVENIVGPDGRTPQTVFRPDAVGQQPFIKSDASSKATNAMAILKDGTQVPAVQGPDGRWTHAQTGQVLPADVQVFDMPKPQGAMKDLGVGGKALASARNDIVAEDLDRTISAITANPKLTAGPIGGLTSGVPGSPSLNVSELLSGIKANVGFDQLSAMRQASPTGGALGAVSDTENKLLQSVLGSMSQSQSPDQLLYNLKRLKNTYLDIIHGPGNGPPREPLDAPGISSGAAGAPGVGAPPAPPSPPAPPGPPSAGPVPVRTPEEARSLPPGTPILLPDGTIGHVPGGQ